MDFDSVFTEQFFPDEEFDESFSSSESENETNKNKINLAAKLKNNKETFDKLKKTKSFSNSKSLSLDELEESKYNPNEEAINK